MLLKAHARTEIEYWSEASVVRPANLPLQNVARDGVQPVSFLPMAKH